MSLSAFRLPPSRRAVAAALSSYQGRPEETADGRLVAAVATPFDPDDHAGMLRAVEAAVHHDVTNEDFRRALKRIPMSELVGNLKLTLSASVSQ